MLSLLSVYTHTPFDGIPHDPFQIFLPGLIPDIRKDRVIGHQGRSEIMAVLLKQAAIQGKAVFIGKLAAKRSGSACSSVPKCPVSDTDHSS
jgi:hypothetical protein